MRVPDAGISFARTRSPIREDRRKPFKVDDFRMRDEHAGALPISFSGFDDRDSGRYTARRGIETNVSAAQAFDFSYRANPSFP